MKQTLNVVQPHHARNYGFITIIPPIFPSTIVLLYRICLNKRRTWHRRTLHPQPLQCSMHSLLIIFSNTSWLVVSSSFWACKLRISRIHLLPCIFKSHSLYWGWLWFDIQQQGNKPSSTSSCIVFNHLIFSSSYGYKEPPMQTAPTPVGFQSAVWWLIISHKPKQ